MRINSKTTIHTHAKKMANKDTDNSLYPIAVLIDELRNDDVNVSLSCLCDRLAVAGQSERKANRSKLDAREGILV